MIPHTYCQNLKRRSAVLDAVWCLTRLYCIYTAFYNQAGSCSASRSKRTVAGSYRTITKLPNCNPLHLFTQVRREKWFHYSLLLKPSSICLFLSTCSSPRASDACHVLFLYEAIVNIPALLPPPAQSLPVLSQPFLCVWR